MILRTVVVLLLATVDTTDGVAKKKLPTSNNIFVRLGFNFEIESEINIWYGRFSMDLIDVEKNINKLSVVFHEAQIINIIKFFEKLPRRFFFMIKSLSISRVLCYQPFGQLLLLNRTTAYIFSINRGQHIPQLISSCTPHEECRHDNCK